jgi:class 3 adenylate cyclase/tetratricopeptide (TPR) repeat protein
MTATIPGPPPPTDDAMDASTYLKPYVPRMVIEWLRDTPAALHQESEATLVFVDISGFTALTERLARKGKVGAEIMRDTLDGVFRALLDEAYDWGAGLLKWGGDALLLKFDGPQHPERAVRAAWEMQQTIDRVGRIHAGGGTVVLRMSVGIGTGTFHFFMGGSVHRELLIAGPAMTETLVMEGIADAGEVGLSPTLAAMLDPSIVGAPKLTTILLAGPPDVERSRAPDVGDVSNLDIPGCIPVAARAHVLLRKSEAEHRTITAAFIDLMDTDRLLAEVGPDALAVGLHERISAIEEAALRYEVPFYETDVGKSSVKALLTAGAPSSTGHDEERMLRTLREVMDQPGLVPMRVGVNTGKVFTGDFGPPYRRAYRVFGDAINTAARVMAKADAGQVLSTEIVLDRSRTLFEATPIEPFAAKGKAALVHASLVGPVLGLKEAKRDDVGLIGREDELDLLLNVIQEARDGHGGIIEIAGDPGLGKSRLVEELVGRSSDFRILRSRSEEYEASTPYFVFRALTRGVIGVDADVEAEACVARLREHVAAVDPSLVPWTPLLGILLGLDIQGTPETAALDERFLRDRLAEVALQFLYRSLSGRPTIFVIEDVQFLDEASRDLLQRLSMAATDVRQVLLVTRQGAGAVFEPAPEGAPESEVTPITTLELGPLPLHAMVAIIEAATEDAPLRPHEVEAIAERSGGNTLFLFELLETVRATGTIEALPDSIESLIAGEIDQLAPTDRTIVRYAAVLGASFDPDLLEAAVRADVELDDQLWDRLGDLIETEPNGDRRFRNTLIRDAAYEGLPYRRRRALHDRVAQTIESLAGEHDEQIAILAFHYHEAQRWDKSWRYSREAGDRAMAIYANVEATRLYEKAMVAGRRQRAVSSRDLATIAERSSDALYRLGEFAKADQALRSAMRWRGNDPIGIAPLVVKQAIIDTRSASYRRAVDRVLRALSHLEGVRGREAAASRSRLMVEVAAIRFLQNRRVESISWCKRAIPEAKRGGAKDAEAQALKVLDGALIENGEVWKARYSGRALELFREIGDLRNQVLVLNNLGVIAHERANWDRSREFFFEALELADEIGDRSLGALAKFNVSDILIDQGRYDDAEPVLREAIRVWRASGADADVAEGQRERALLMMRRRAPGDMDEASQLLEAARGEQTSAGKLGEVLITDSRRAELEVLAGRPASALAIADRGLVEAERTDGGSLVVPRLERTRGWALLQSGRPKEAAKAFARAERLARKGEDIYELAQALDGIVEVRRSTSRAWETAAAERDAIYKRLGIIAPVQVPTTSEVALSA